MYTFITVKSTKHLIKKMSSKNPQNLQPAYESFLVRINIPVLPLFVPLLRRRRTKLQAHLKESRSLKNYAVNSLNALEAKTRAPDISMPMHEVNFAFFFFYF